MGLLYKAQFYDNEVVKSADIELSARSFLDNLSTLLRVIADPGINMIFTGFEASPATPASLNVKISEGLAYCPSTGLFVYNGDESTLIPFDAADPSYDRIDIIEVQQDLLDDSSTQQRAFRDPNSGVISYALVALTENSTASYVVKKGTATGSPVAPTVDAGYVKITEVRVRAGSTQILETDIENCDANKTGASNTSWTTEATGTYRLGSLDALKTLLVDHIADLAPHGAAQNTPSRLVIRRSDGKLDGSITGDAPTLAGTTPGAGGKLLLALAALSSASPLVDGTASAGTSNTPAREDHAHPTNLALAKLNTTRAQMQSITYNAGALVWFRLCSISSFSSVSFQCFAAGSTYEEQIDFEVFTNYALDQTCIKGTRQSLTAPIAAVYVRGSDGGAKTVYVGIDFTGHADSGVSFYWRYNKGATDSLTVYGDVVAGPGSPTARFDIPAVELFNGISINTTTYEIDTVAARNAAIAAAVAAAVASGSWPNTLTAIAGCSGLSTVPQHYLRIGNKVSFAFVVTGTFGAGQNTFAFTLPISSDFTLATDLSGVACGDGSLLTSLVGAAYADTTNNRGIVSVYVGSAKTGTIVVSGMYGIK